MEDEWWAPTSRGLADGKGREKKCSENPAFAGAKRDMLEDHGMRARKKHVVSKIKADVAP